MKILIYRNTHLLTSGGVEKILALLSSKLAERGHEVHLVTADVFDGEMFYSLNPKVHFKHLKIKFSKIRRFLVKALGLRHLLPSMDLANVAARRKKKYIDSVKPDILLLSAMTDLECLTRAGITYDCPIITMLHGHPSAYFTDRTNPIYSEYINKNVLVQVLMESFMDLLPSYYHGRTVAIGNAVIPNPLRTNHTEKVVVYLARIIPDKQHHLLIDAFGKLADRFPKWELHLWGDDWDKEYLQFCKDMINGYNLNDRILFKGITSNPYEVLANSSIFAFPSKIEGFGLAFVEAMTTGLPCIGFKSCSGINEFVHDGIDGFLAENQEDFIGKLDLLMSDRNLRERLGDKAIEIAKKYSVEEIVSKWESLLDAEIKNWKSEHKNL